MNSMAVWPLCSSVAHGNYCCPTENLHVSALKSDLLGLNCGPALLVVWFRTVPQFLYKLEIVVVSIILVIKAFSETVNKVLSLEPARL